MLRPAPFAMMLALAAAPLAAQDTTTSPDADATGGTSTTESTASESAATDSTTTAAPDTVVATVNGQDITLGHMAILRAGLPQQYQQLPIDTLFTGILDQLIQQVALSSTVDQLAPASQKALENEERALKANIAIRDIAEGAMTDEAIQAAYDAEYGSAEPSTEYNASHILVETEEEATAIRQELEDGADFADVAREKSTGPSGPSGGSLGWFGEGQMVAPFEEAVKALEPGQISDPIETQFGWHVITLLETRDKAIPTLEEVRPQLAEQVQRAAVEERIAEMTDEASVERKADGLSPEVLNDPSLYQQ